LFYQHINTIIKSDNDAHFKIKNPPNSFEFFINFYNIVIKSSDFSLLEKKLIIKNIKKEKNFILVLYFIFLIGSY